VLLCTTNDTMYELEGFSNCFFHPPSLLKCVTGTEM
jgi:hypothetical protein